MRYVCTSNNECQESTLKFDDVRLSRHMENTLRRRRDQWSTMHDTSLTEHRAHLYRYFGREIGMLGRPWREQPHSVTQRLKSANEREAACEERPRQVPVSTEQRPAMHVFNHGADATSSC